MSNEMTVVEQPKENQPDPNAINVINYNPVFPTIIAQVKLDLPVQDMAADLMNYANGRENYEGGFTTFYDRSTIDHLRGIKQLQEAIYGVCASFMKEMKYHVNLEKCSIQLWANVMKKDGFHGIHNHPRSVLSGTYYVQTSSESAPIIFENPLNIYRGHDCTVEKPEDHSPFTSPILGINAEPNTMLVWPSWLYHHVPRHTSTLPRISLSFNVDYLPVGV